MQAVMWYRQNDIQVEEQEERSVEADEVRIEINTCGICGSDLHEYAAGPIFIPDEEPYPVSGDPAPIIMGHEFSGTISEFGAVVDNLQEGEPVAVNPIMYCGECSQCIERNYHIYDSGGFIGLSGGGGGFAENIVVSTEKAVPLGENVLQ